MSDGNAIFDTFLNHNWIPNWDTHPTESLLEMVIVEPRRSNDLPRVLKNMSALVPNAMLTILHSKDNAELLRNTIYPNGVNNIRLIPYFDGNSSRDAYNKIMMSPEFWSLLRAPKTLIFQIDSGMRYNRLLRFMEYDYIGAPWTHTASMEFPSVKIGNGGFSLRSKHYMEDIVRRRPCQVTPDIMPEDVYFGTNIHLYNDTRIPSIEEASMFSLEYARHPDPMAFHQCYRLNIHEPNYLESLLVSDVACKHPCRIVKIIDAWVECENGYICRTYDIVAWLNIGVSSYGMHVPKGSYITCIQEDPFPGYRKYLKAKILVDHNDLRLYTIRLHKNTIEDDLLI